MCTSTRWWESLVANSRPTHLPYALGGKMGASNLHIRLQLFYNYIPSCTYYLHLNINRPCGTNRSCKVAQTNLLRHQRITKRLGSPSVQQHCDIGAYMGPPQAYVDTVDQKQMEPYTRRRRRASAWMMIPARLRPRASL